MPEFTRPTPASSNEARFFNWPGAGEGISEALNMTHACFMPSGASVIHVGGQAGIKSDGTVPTDLTEDLRKAFSHIELSLRESGLTGPSKEVWDCLYKVRTYHANADASFGLTLHGILMEYFGKGRPLFTGVDAFKLLIPELHLEIEVKEFLPNSQA